MVKLLIDSSLCTGCMSCMSVCSLSQSGKQNPSYSAIRVNLELFTGNHSHTWCRQCTDPQCAAACPGEAIRLEPSTGAWVIVSSLCIRCGICVDSCPFNAIVLTEEMDNPMKCNLCRGEPLCAEACRFQAIKVVKEKD